MPAAIYSLIFYLPIFYQYPALHFCVLFLWVWNMVCHFEGRLFKKRVKEMGEWRKFDEELHDLYSLPDISSDQVKGAGWVGHVACVGGGGIIQGFSGEA
jgi:hypothetical protein